jgi:hypothetical protein
MGTAVLRDTDTVITPGEKDLFAFVRMFPYCESPLRLFLLSPLALRGLV